MKQGNKKPLLRPLLYKNLLKPGFHIIAFDVRIVSVAEFLPRDRDAGI